MFRHSSKPKRMTIMGICPTGKVHLFVSLWNLALNEVTRENTMHCKKSSQVVGVALSLT